MTPDVLDMSGSHVGTALRVAMNAYHKAARTGFTLMDVSNAPLAKRRKKKNFSSESQKGSDDSTETNESKASSEAVSKKEFSVPGPDSSDSERTLSVDSNTQRNIPALAVCLSPSVSRQSIIDTVATSREPPPLRPISGDCECILSGNSSGSTDSNFFFKDFHDSSSAQVYSQHGYNRPPVNISRHYTNQPDTKSRKQYHYVDTERGAFLGQDALAGISTREGSLPSQGLGSKVIVQSAHGASQYTCTASIPTTKQSRTTEADMMNNNIIDIALSGLREGNRTRKRPYQP